MAKKNNKVQIMTDTELSSKINLNLNQDDLIQMVIEEKIEQIEKVIVLKEAEIKAITDNQKILFTDFATKFLNLEEEPLYKRFKVIADDMNGTINVSIKDTNLYTNLQTNKDSDQSNSYRMSNEWDRCEEGKQPLTQFLRYVYMYTIQLTNLNEIYVDFSVREWGPGNSCNCTIELHSSFKKTFKDKDKAAYEKLMNPTITALVKAKNELHELKKSYLETKYGERKIKAQITKASLRKSDSGQALLNMLEQASNIKFLS